MIYEKYLKIIEDRYTDFDTWMLWNLPRWLRTVIKTVGITTAVVGGLTAVVVPCLLWVLFPIYALGLFSEDQKNLSGIFWAFVWWFGTPFLTWLAYQVYKNEPKKPERKKKKNDDTQTEEEYSDDVMEEDQRRSSVMD